VIRLQGLRVAYGDDEVVRALSLDVAPGSWACLIGPNGAGKSSVLRALAGLVPHRGRAEVGGHDVGSGSPRRLARLAAFVPQQPELPPDMEASDYVLLGRTAFIRWFRTETPHDRRVAATMLERLDLAAFAHRPLGTLSGGELQRLVLARALAQEAPVLLLDEPTSALDVGHQLQVLELVDRLRREHGLTVLSAMHDLTLAGQFAERLVLLQRGAVVATGSPSEVLTESAIAEHYGARVQVLTGPEGATVVVPVRSPAPAIGSQESASA
jgi:iron complex transport system ATP-binding protein